MIIFILRKEKRRRLKKEVEVGAFSLLTPEYHILIHIPHIHIHYFYYPSLVNTRLLGVSTSVYPYNPRSTTSLTHFIQFFNILQFTHIPFHSFITKHQPTMQQQDPQDNNNNNNNNDGRKRIQRLDEVVINRIAAGEIIQRPANVLKELIENSLDAGSKTISVVVKDGGLKFLQISDTGCGIHKDDLEIVCERFTTSKLRQYEDLSNMSTFGFRGEALASISHVAHLTITTKTPDSNCAYRAVYSDGKLVPAKPGASPDPKPCAGNNGTQITVEDLFYNVPTRRKALKNTTEEYNRILDVMNRYAIHYSGISFSCKKQGSNQPDLYTPLNATIVDTIRTIYGHAIARELLSIPTYTHESLQFKLDAQISNPNYSMKKMTFLLFINHRLVESTHFKKSLEALYTPFLPKNSHPFIYLSLEINPQNVDVNVHPTKREVHFLHEDEIIQAVVERLSERLEGANESRTFLTQTVITGGMVVRPVGTIGEKEKEKEREREKPYEYQLVRTDSKTRTLDSFVTFLEARKPGGNEKKRVEEEDDDMDDDELEDEDVVEEPRVVKKPRLEEVVEDAACECDHDHGDTEERVKEMEEDEVMQLDTPTHEPEPQEPQPQAQPLAIESLRKDFIQVRLTSILELRQQLLTTSHTGLTELFRSHTFVGCVDPSLALIQFRTKLYLIHIQELSVELFYQLTLRAFSNFGIIQLSVPAPIYTLVLLALEEEMNLMENGIWDSSLKPASVIAKEITQLLISRREMLVEYFSMSVSEQGVLETLPLMLKGYIPNLDKLPGFLLRLGTEVDWEEEKGCFEGFARELAWFYALEPPFISEEGDGGNTKQDNDSTEMKKYYWTVEHLICPALKSSFIASEKFVESGDVLQVANLPDLYKVFERC